MSEIKTLKYMDIQTCDIPECDREAEHILARKNKEYGKVIFMCNNHYHSNGSECPGCGLLHEGGGFIKELENEQELENLLCDLCSNCLDELYKDIEEKGIENTIALYKSLYSEELKERNETFK